MEFNKEQIIFNAEERFIAGLPETMELSLAVEAFRTVRRARTRCLEIFEDLLTCDLDRLGEADMQLLPLYPERLRRLDELSQRMVPVVAPVIIDELETNLHSLATAGSLPYFR